MASDGFETVHLARDGAEAAMLAGALRAEAIDARVIEVNAALLGAGPQIFRIEIEVPAELAARARELLDELGHPGKIEDAAAPPGDDDAGPTPEVRSPWRAVVGLLLPGGGHFYARHPWTAIVAEIGILACLLVLRLDEDQRFLADFTFATLFAIPLCDVVGGFLATRAQNGGGAPTTWPRQAARGVAMLSAAAAMGAAVAGLAAIPAWNREAPFRKLSVGCEPQRFTVENHDTTDRVFLVVAVGVHFVGGTADGTFTRLSLTGPSSVVLAPGALGTIEFEQPEDVRAACDPTSGESWCSLGVLLRTYVSDEPVEAIATCVLRGPDGPTTAKLRIEPPH